MLYNKENELADLLKNYRKDAHYEPLKRAVSSYLRTLENILEASAQLQYEKEITFEGLVEILTQCNTHSGQAFTHYLKASKEQTLDKAKIVHKGRIALLYLNFHEIQAILHDTKKVIEKTEEPLSYYQPYTKRDTKGLKKEDKSYLTGAIRAITRSHLDSIIQRLTASGCIINFVHFNLERIGENITQKRMAALYQNDIAPEVIGSYLESYRSDIQLALSALNTILIFAQNHYNRYPSAESYVLALNLIELASCIAPDQIPLYGRQLITLEAPEEFKNSLQVAMSDLSSICHGGHTSTQPNANNEQKIYIKIIQHDTIRIIRLITHKLEEEKNNCVQRELNYLLSNTIGTNDPREKRNYNTMKQKIHQGYYKTNRHFINPEPYQTQGTKKISSDLWVNTSEAEINDPEHNNRQEENNIHNKAN